MQTKRKAPLVRAGRNQTRLGKQLFRFGYKCNRANCRLPYRPLHYAVFVHRGRA